MKKLVSLILVLALTLGCAAALAENKKMDTLTFQFVPSKDADVIIADKDFRILKTFVGGVCRYEPEQEGVRMSYNYTW